MNIVEKIKNKWHYMNIDINKYLSDPFCCDPIINKKICDRYPWLTPVNTWTGNKIDDFNYTFTELDYIPEGWRIAFGREWVKEMDEAMKKIPIYERNCLYIIQLKEKYGSFRQYFSIETQEMSNVIAKYERLSMRTCINCGKHATCLTTNYVSPFCDDCAKCFIAEGEHTEPITNND